MPIYIDVQIDCLPVQFLYGAEMSSNLNGLSENSKLAAADLYQPFWIWLQSNLSHNFQRISEPSNTCPVGRGGACRCDITGHSPLPDRPCACLLLQLVGSREQPSMRETLFPPEFKTGISLSVLGLQHRNGQFKYYNSICACTTRNLSDLPKTNCKL